MADDAAPLGPISYLIVEFPGNKMTGEGFSTLVDLVDGGVIRILDLVFVTRDADGSMRSLMLADLDHDGTVDLAVFEGVSSGLLDQSDFDDAASTITPGSSAGILIFENRWATGFVQALRKGGAELVAAGYIPQDTLARVARRDGQLIDRRTRTCPDFFAASPAPPSSPEPPPRCRTASPAARPTVGRSRRSSSTSNSSTQQQQPQPQYVQAAASARRAGKGHRDAAERARRAEGAGHSHRGRVRSPEGKSPGDVNSDWRTLCSSSTGLARPGCPTGRFARRHSSSDTTGSCRISSTRRVRVPPPMVGAPDPPPDTVTALKELAELRASGMIDDAEFAAAKAKVLDADATA